MIVYAGWCSRTRYRTFQYTTVFHKISQWRYGTGQEWTHTYALLKTCFIQWSQQGTVWTLLRYLYKHTLSKACTIKATSAPEPGRAQRASCQIRKIAGAHAPSMPTTFSLPPRVRDPDMHHGTCVTHVPWCMPGSPTRGFHWSRCRGKTFPAFPAHAHPQFYVSGKRPMQFSTDPNRSH